MKEPNEHVTQLSQTLCEIQSLSSSGNNWHLRVDCFLKRKVVPAWHLQSPAKLRIFTAPSLTKYSVWCSSRYSYQFRALPRTRDQLESKFNKTSHLKERSNFIGGLTLCWLLVAPSHSIFYLKQGFQASTGKG